MKLFNLKNGDKIMKRIIFLICVQLLILGLPLAYSEEVSLSVGPQYVNQVWYNIPFNTQEVEPLAFWDIAFFSYNQNAAIRINSGAGAKLWEVLGRNIDDFDMEIDTTGLTSDPERFVEWHNSDTSWTIGAFNRGRDGFETEGDFGWGAYDMNTHAIVGDKLFIFRSIEGKYYMFAIQDLISGTYTFKYRLLNTTETITREYAKSFATSKLFGYYLISTDEFIDKEPLQNEWELLFTKYTAMILDDNGNTVPYPVMGVLSNQGIKVAKVENVPPINAELPLESDYSTNISTIGHTWKSFDMQNGWSIVPDLSYFVIANNGEIYQIYFKTFGGSATGDITFENHWVEVGVKEEFEAGNTFILSPNIIERNDAFNLLLNANSSSYTAELNVYSITGENILTNKLNVANGLNAFSIENNFASGMYIVTLKVNGKLQVQKLIIK